MRNRSTFVTLALIGFLMNAAPAAACSCTGPGTPLEELAQRDAVFSGRVLFITPVDDYDIDASILVYSVWKGTPAGVITVRTSAESAMCGFFFEVGSEYLIYANDMIDPAHLWTDNCQRSVRLSQAEFDLAELGTPSTVPTLNLDWGALKGRYR